MHCSCFSRLLSAAHGSASRHAQEVLSARRAVGVLGLVGELLALEVVALDDFVPAGRSVGDVVAGEVDCCDHHQCTLAACGLIRRTPAWVRRRDATPQVALALAGIVHVALEPDVALAAFPGRDELPLGSAHPLSWAARKSNTPATWCRHQSGRSDRR